MHLVCTLLKNPPRKPNTKIHESLQGRGVLDTSDMPRLPEVTQVTPQAEALETGTVKETGSCGLSQCVRVGGSCRGATRGAQWFRVN